MQRCEGLTWNYLLQKIAEIISSLLLMLILFFRSSIYSSICVYLLHFSICVIKTKTEYLNF